MIYRTLMFLALAMAVAQLPLAADPPYLVNYQGTLLGTGGEPIPAGNYYLKFQIVDKDGNPVWGPTDPVLAEVYGGNFNTILSLDGSKKAISDPAVFMDGERRLQMFYGLTPDSVTTSGGTDIEVLSAPYSVHTIYAPTADSVDGANVTGKVPNAAHAILGLNLVGVPDSSPYGLDNFTLDLLRTSLWASRNTTYVAAVGRMDIFSPLWQGVVLTNGSRCLATDGEEIVFNPAFSAGSSDMTTILPGVFAWGEDVSQLGNVWRPRANQQASDYTYYNATVFAKRFIAGLNQFPWVNLLPQDWHGHPIASSLHAIADTDMTAVTAMRMDKGDRMWQVGVDEDQILEFQCCHLIGNWPELIYVVGLTWGGIDQYSWDDPYQKAGLVSVLPQVAQLPAPVMSAPAPGLPGTLSFPPDQLRQAIPELARQGKDASGKATNIVSTTQMGVYALAASKEANEQMVASQQKVDSLEARIAALEARLKAKK